VVGGSKERIADFVHGDDGFGNTAQPAPTGTALPGQTVGRRRLTPIFSAVGFSDEAKM
jgi:hypothetical protein